LPRTFVARILSPFLKEVRKDLGVPNLSFVIAALGTNRSFQEFAATPRHFCVCTVFHADRTFWRRDEFRLMRCWNRLLLMG